MARMTSERARPELAAGVNVTPYIKALEQFSSIGGMLPEQVWDYADLPSEGLYFGRSAGSAQPLVWAHAEYVKLLRSVADGRVFDRISVVEERYGVPKDQRNFMSRMEIFQLSRPISAMVQGGTFRIIDARPFQVTWTVDDWATTIHTESTVVGPPGSFADICISPQTTGTLIFTLYWPGQDRWLGRNVEVSINATSPNHARRSEAEALPPQWRDLLLPPRNPQVILCSHDHAKLGPHSHLLPPRRHRYCAGRRPHFSRLRHQTSGLPARLQRRRPRPRPLGRRRQWLDHGCSDSPLSGRIHGSLREG